MRDFRRRAEEEHNRPVGQETVPASGNSWCAGDPCWLHAPPPGRREGTGRLCESRRGLNVTLRYVSVSLCNSDSARSVVHDYVWAPLGCRH